MDKPRVLALLKQRIAEDLARATAAQHETQRGATHEEARPEYDKDTRALEASYLAGAQAARVRDIEGAIKAIGAMRLLDLTGKEVQSSALVTLEDEDGGTSLYFLAPFGGGTTVDLGDRSAQVITPQSPLGRALLGRTEGDVIEVRGGNLPQARGQKLREMTIVDVA